MQASGGKGEAFFGDWADGFSCRCLISSIKPLKAILLVQEIQTKAACDLYTTIDACNTYTTWLRCHCQAGYSFGAVAPWPLQRCSCGFAGDDISPFTDSLACSSTYCSRLKALWELHWLPITQRLQYKLCLLVHKMFVGHAPDYTASLLTPASDIPSQSSLRSSSK